MNSKSKRNGFTLIETMVSLGVFMVAMTIIMAAFLNMMDIQKKTEAFRKVNDNLNFAMEAMMREIREGTKYCPSGCADGTFLYQQRPEMRLNTKLKTGVEGYIERTKGRASQRMTSDGIKITKLSFSVKGNVAGINKQQPIVTISISGESGIKAKLKSKLNLQATVSQRKLDTEL